MTRAERERLVQVVLYFAQHAPGSTAKKLFKLLYLLDVAQVQASGRSVTGLAYAAYTPGPVPWELQPLLESLPPDLAAAVVSTPYKDGGKIRHIISAREGALFDDGHFSSWQLNKLATIAAAFKDLDESQIDVGQYDHGAWHAAFTRGREEPIVWEDALDHADPYRGDKARSATDQAKHNKGMRLLAL